MNIKQLKKLLNEERDELNNKTSKTQISEAFRE
jgi:hypothetical protein